MITRDTEQFLDPRYFGAGWKAMNTDLSLPYLSARSFKILDDSNNWGLKKFALGEVDVFQIDSTHELYSHMNASYVQLDRVPEFDRYGEVLDAVANGRFWVSRRARRDRRQGARGMDLPAAPGADRVG